MNIISKLSPEKEVDTFENINFDKIKQASLDIEIFKKVKVLEEVPKISDELYWMKGYIGAT